jgi:hypothetical protein
MICFRHLQALHPKEDKQRTEAHQQVGEVSRYPGYSSLIIFEIKDRKKSELWLGYGLIEILMKFGNIGEVQMVLV